MTMLCVPILVDSPEQGLRLAAEARDGGADLVELRLDTYYTGDDDAVQIPAIISLISQCPLPCIATCRPVLEGGHYGGPDAARIALYQRLGSAAGPGQVPPRYIDCELATYTRSASSRQSVNLAVEHPGHLGGASAGLILSTHNFQTRPPDLIRQIEAMLKEPATRVVKVAYFARSIRDNIELLDLAAELRREHGKASIMLGMGPFGLMSRVLAPKFGALLTFAALRRDEQTAPGQPILRELTEDYRFSAISESTKVYGIVGWPVEHALSPMVHNAGFEAVSHDGVYLPMPIAGGEAGSYESFKGTLLDFIEHASLDFAGCSVTIPHKENLVALAREMTEAGDTRWHLDRLSQACDAANTLTVRRDARGAAVRLDVTNTDGPGFISALIPAVGEVAGRDVVILGAGGTARAIAAALLLEGARVWIINRTLARADELAASLDAALGGGRPIARTDVSALARLAPAAVVNCTSLGMRGGPGPDRCPLDEQVLATLPSKCVIADCVYRPVQTPLLRAAMAVGLPTLDGVGMFVEQAALQFAQWTGTPAPRRLFERTVREIAG